MIRVNFVLIVSFLLPVFTVMQCSEPVTQPGTPMSQVELEFLKNKEQEVIQFLESREADKQQTEKIRNLWGRISNMAETEQGREILKKLGLIPCVPPLSDE